MIAPLGRRSAGAHEALLVAAGTIGVLVGLAGRAWAPWLFALAVATGAAGIIAVRLTDRCHGRSGVACCRPVGD